MWLFCWLVLASTGLAPSAARSSPPQRLVSINLCSDQLLLLLSKPELIASVTYLAANPQVSPLAKAARGIPINYGQTEEILRFKPDLVLASSLTTHSTNALLQKLGIPVLVVPVANNIQDIRKNIHRVARAIGQTERAAELLRQFDRNLHAVGHPPSPNAALAALYRENNILYGANTLPGTFIAAAGLKNLADRLHLDGYSDLPLEILIEQQPDLVISGSGSARAGSGIRAYRNLAHPALLELIATRQWVQVPERYWACGSPAIAKAIAVVAAAHQKWQESQTSPEDSHGTP